VSNDRSGVIVTLTCQRTSQPVGSWGCTRHPNFAKLVAQRDSPLSASQGVLGLMDEVEIDLKLGNETDRCFARWEFETLREAVERSESEADHA